MSAALTRCLDAAPLIAVLRGLEPPQAGPVGEVLVEAGFQILEVPCNSPEPLQSIERLAARFQGADVLVGAGTVMTEDAVHAVHDAGGRLIVSPHLDDAVVAAAAVLDLAVVPGVATPSEAFAALGAGASALKLFPAEMITPTVVKALRAVLADDVLLIPTGGITPDNLRAYWQAGANGFGVGGALFKPGLELAEIRRRAERFIAAAQALPAR